MSRTLNGNLRGRAARTFDIETGDTLTLKEQLQVSLEVAESMTKQTEYPALVAEGNRRKAEIKSQLQIIDSITPEEHEKYLGNLIHSAYMEPQE